MGYWVDSSGSCGNRQYRHRCPEYRASAVYRASFRVEYNCGASCLLPAEYENGDADTAWGMETCEALFKGIQ